jgi:hypothetical protein
MLNRESLGQLVRAVWVECARELPNPKPSNLLSWAELDKWNKEVDRKIGERIKSEVLLVVAQRLQAIMESPDNPGDGVDELLSDIWETKL